MLINDRVTDRRAVQQAASLREAGFRVEFVSRRHGVDDATEVDGFLIRRMDFAGEERKAAALARKLLVPRLAFQLPQMKLALLRYANRALLPQLQSIYASQEVYAVQSHDLDTGWLGLQLARALGVPFVFDSHEAYPHRIGMNPVFRRYYQKLEPQVIAGADFWMIVNELLGRWLVEYHAKKGVRLPAPLVVENAVPYRADDAKTDTLRSKLALGPEARIALYQGGLAPRRNLENVVRMAEYLDDRWKVVVLGSGKFSADLALQAGGLFGKKVFFIKAVPQRELMAYTASADVGLIPYKAVDPNTTFCSPNKLFEFIQAGLPIVANRLPFLEQKIKATRTGWLTNFDVPAEAAALLNGLQPGDLAAMRTNVLQAKRSESWEEHAVRYVERMIGLAHAGSFAAPGRG